MNQNEPTTRNITVLNRASVKKYALVVSQQERAGKFTRVSESFLESCEADLEAAIRRLSPTPEDRPSGVVEMNFITKSAREKAEEKLEYLAMSIVRGKVKRHPSIGCTLQS